MAFRNKLERVSPAEINKAFRMAQASAHLGTAQPVQEGHTDWNLEIERNGVRYKIGVFSKTLPHNEFGEVAKQYFDDLQRATFTGKQSDWDRISRDSLAVRKLANPQAALAYSYMGQDTQSVQIPHAPSLISDQAAAEMMEVYEKALHRDITFHDIQTKNLTSVNRAISTLNSFGSEFRGRKDPESGLVTQQTLFRGMGSDEHIGPFVSQLLLKPFNYGNMEMVQKFREESDQLSSVSVDTWLEIQRGIYTGSPNYTDNYQYIHTPRMLASYVHNDPVFMAYDNACLILMQNGAPLDPNIPVLKNESGFVTFGLADIVLNVANVGKMALQAAWHHKWMINLRLRPEAMAGRIHFQDAGEAQYGINANNRGSATLQAVKAHNQSKSEENTALLPLMYPEGSPTHPSYPAGHAVVAGACTTIIKAFFDTTKTLSEISMTPEHSIDGNTLVPYTDSDASEMTLLGELNKLASNIAIGRNMAGVHYRSDGDQGILLGEQIAIDYLKDLKETYNEDFSGWNLTKFDGTTILV